MQHIDLHRVANKLTISVLFSQKFSYEVKNEPTHLGLSIKLWIFVEAFLQSRVTWLYCSSESGNQDSFIVGKIWKYMYRWQS